MSIVRNIVIYLIYINSLSFALKCTTDCFFTLNFNSPFEIPTHCNQTASAKQCEVYLSISYEDSYIAVSFSAFTYDINMNDNHYASLQLFDHGLSTFSYSITRYCKNKDDCARDFAYSSLLEIINRPPVNHTAIRNEIFPLLTSNLSLESADLSCFDSSERVRQCGIAKIPGACQISHQLIGQKTVNRSCDNDLFLGSQQQVTMIDGGMYASFNIKCNRSLCNGPMTLKAVKEIMFKYNVTKTMEGRLSNHSLHLSLSFSLSILILIISLTIL